MLVWKWSTVCIISSLDFSLGYRFPTFKGWEEFCVKASSVLVLAALSLFSQFMQHAELEESSFAFFSLPWSLLWTPCACQGWASGSAVAHPWRSESRSPRLLSHSAPSLALPPELSSFLPLRWQHPSALHNCWLSLHVPSGYHSSPRTNTLH